MKTYNTEGNAIKNSYVYNPNDDKAVRTNSSFFVNWKVVSTLPKAYGKEVSFKKVPYKSRING